MKEMKTTAQVLVDCLEAEGVDVMFGIPGEETLDLMFAIRDSKIRFIPVRHEQGAAFMADVYGRLTGRAGVCLSTLGPGATNLVTGVADAYLDGAPLGAITGQVGTDRCPEVTIIYKRASVCPMKAADALLIIYSATPPPTGRGSTPQAC